MTHTNLQALARAVSAGDPVAATTLATELESGLRRMIRRARRGPVPTDKLGRMLRAERREESENHLATRLSRRVIDHLRGLAATAVAGHDTVQNSCLPG